MATSVSWATKIINVLRADMTLIQTTPTEIRELNLNTFRLDLKSLEDGEEGMTFLDTHQHNTEVLLGGITYARVLEIINGYTVTFEDGQYAVNLVGANSNVGDVVNVNQVSVRSNNSAGLTSSPAIEYASFNGGVTIDTTVTTSGTAYDLGTPGNPVGNLTDAKLIAAVRGFNKLFIKGDITFLSGDNISLIEIHGEDSVKTIVTADPGAITAGTEFFDCTIQGTLVSPTGFTNCTFIDVTGNTIGISGTIVIKNCDFKGTITLSSLLVGEVHIFDSKSGIAGTTTPVFDSNGADVNVLVRNWSGGMTIKNFSNVAANNISVDIHSGQIILEATNTTGTITLRGDATLTDNSNGTVVNTAGLVFPDELQLSAFNGVVAIDDIAGIPGTKFPLGTRSSPVSNLADAKIIAAARGLTELLIIGSLGIGPFDNIDNLKITGDNNQTASIFIVSGASTVGTIFRTCFLSGVVSGNIQAFDCQIFGVSNIGSDDVASSFYNCLLIPGFSPSISLRAGLTTPKTIIFTNCFSAASGQGTILFDVNGADSEITILGWRGSLTFNNWTAGQNGNIEVNSGIIIASSTCTDGTLVVRGITDATDNSTGTFSLDTSGVLNETVIATEIWNSVSEGTLTYEEVIRIMKSVLVGKATATQSPNQVSYRDEADLKDRAVILHSDDGDRTSVTIDGA